MVARIVQREVEFLAPGCGCLVRAGIDEIESKALEQRVAMLSAASASTTECLTSEIFKIEIVQRLNAQRKPIDAGRLDSCESARLDAGRVGFERDSASLSKVQCQAISFMIASTVSAP